MLKLKRVEIHGFKSFYDRTEMKFNGSGVAAIVGPNGCGKSNLSDAISWVLGEQSAKTLRGARMEDVIFAGTRDKKALGMAAVTMTLAPGEAIRRALPNSESANGHGTHKSEVLTTAERIGEITITRRLYRSGESEYLINGKLARLRDIQDLFLGTGLGPESYAIIEQGRIGQILSNRPQDRRNVIEEAAGITKFKTRKRLAEAKLESAKQNLSRVFDILEEVTRQANSLKRQAAKTKRYSELKNEAVTYLRQVLAGKFRMLERETAKIAIELNLVSAELRNAQAAIAKRESDQAVALETSYATERELTEGRKLLADFEIEAERARGRLENQVRQIQQTERRLAAGGEEASALEKQHQEMVSELERQKSEVNTLEGGCARAERELKEKSAERQQAQNRLDEQENALEAARQRVLRLLGESAALKNRITQVEAQIVSADRDTARVRGEQHQAEDELSEIGKLKSQLSERLEASQLELVSVTDQRTATEDELREKRGRLNESRQALDRVRADLSRLKARKDSLEDVLRHRSYSTETVKRFFTAVEHGTSREVRPIGVLADFLEVDPQLEKAAEEFLHDELEYVVVRDWADAERGIELMRADLNGRATFLVEAGTEQSDAPAELAKLAAQQGITAKLTDALRFTNGLSTIPLQTLPRIANCYIVADRALGQELASQFPQYWFLAADGVNYHGRAVSGGKKTGAGPLALKRELREVSRLEEGKQGEFNAAQATLTELERIIAVLAEDFEALRARQQTQEKSVLAIDHETRKVAEEFQRIQSRLSHAGLELDRLSRGRMQLQDTLERDRQAAEECDRMRAAEERALEGARELLTALQEQAAAVAEEHAGLRASLASLEERRRSAETNAARVQLQVQEFSHRLVQLAIEAEQLTEHRAQLLASNAEIESKSGELNASIAATEQRVKNLASQESELRTLLAET
ncbi:MAG: chromosome segregation protein SMC, partial [Bryobacteraceae bacterium]